MKRVLFFLAPMAAAIGLGALVDLPAQAQTISSLPPAVVPFNGSELVAIDQTNNGQTNTYKAALGSASGYSVGVNGSAICALNLSCTWTGQQTFGALSIFTAGLSVPVNGYNGYTPANPGAATTYTAPQTFSGGFGPSSAAGLYQLQGNAQSAYNPEGDSITNGLSASPQAFAYANQIASDTGMLLTNRGIGGEQACDMTMNETTLENPGPSNNPLYTVMIGTNDANHGGVGAYEAVYNACHQAALTWLSIPSTFKVMDAAAAATGTWGADASPWNNIPGAEVSTTAGSTLSFQITTTGGPIYLWYYVSDTWTGNFTYSVDGGSAVSVANHATPAIATNNGGTGGLMVARIPVAAGSHTVVVTDVGGAVAAPVAVGTPSNLVERGAAKVYVGGVPRQQNDANSAATSEYNADAAANVALLQADGLPVYFVDVRSYLNSTTDMANSLHPNNTGHRHLADAFESVAQPSNSPPTWQNYTPATPPTPNSGAFGSVSYGATQYIEMNHTVWFQVTIQVTTAGTASGCVTYGLPVQTSSDNISAVSIIYNSPLAMGLGNIGGNGTTASVCSLSNGSPFTGNGSAIVITGVYKAAY